MYGMVDWMRIGLRYKECMLTEVSILRVWVRLAILDVLRSRSKYLGRYCRSPVMIFYIPFCIVLCLYTGIPNSPPGRYFPVEDREGQDDTHAIMPLRMTSQYMILYTLDCELTRICPWIAHLHGYTGVGLCVWCRYNRPKHFFCAPPSRNYRVLSN